MSAIAVDETPLEIGQAEHLGRLWAERVFATLARRGSTPPPWPPLAGQMVPNTRRRLYAVLRRDEAGQAQVKACYGEARRVYEALREISERARG